LLLSFFFFLLFFVSQSLRYKFDTPFEREIKQEVFKIVRRGREFGTPGYFFRAFCYIAAFFYLQYLWITEGSSWQLAIIYGLSQSMIGMNVQHDANHGACSKRPWVNDLLGLGADFIGGSKWLWQEQHWTHHAYTNHAEKDPDSFGAEPMLLFNDYPLGHPARKWFHALQVLYYIPVLAGYWLSSVFNPQILDLKQRGAQFVGIQMESDFIKSRRKYAVMLRILYIYVNAVTPFLYHGLCWRALGDVLLLGVADSLGLAVLFSLSHNFVDADRDPTKPLRKDGEQVCWFKSQVETSCTYGGFVSGCFTGGLNFQVEHHLFPRMSSAWYPYIAPKVREICAKHGVRYVYYPWVHQNLMSTVKYLYATGTGANWKNNPLSGNL
jgi:acyl-lipid (7-3)-desaturase (Delta-4 desaturase)